MHLMLLHHAGLVKIGSPGVLSSPPPITLASMRGDRARIVPFLTKLLDESPDPVHQGRAATAFNGPWARPVVPALLGHLKGDKVDAVRYNAAVARPFRLRADPDDHG